MSSNLTQYLHNTKLAQSISVVMPRRMLFVVRHGRWTVNPVDTNTSSAKKKIDNRHVLPESDTQKPYGYGSIFLCPDGNPLMVVLLCVCEYLISR